MVKRVQHLRHQTAEANDFTGREGEFTMDTTAKEIRLHDGITPGGNRILNLAQLQAIFQTQGVNEFDTLKANVITERTGNAGVTIETVLVKDGLVDGRDVSADWTTSSAHFANVSNPHAVTKAQVGLANVTNDAQLKIASNLSDVANAATALSNIGGQPLDTDLSAVAALATTGLLARTGAGTFSTRTVTGTSNQITMTNGSGVAGDPTIAIASDAVLPGTGSVTVPTGTQAQRPSSGAGKTRWNSTLGALEVSDGTNWKQLSYLDVGIRGMRLSNNGVDPNNDVDIATGYCMSDDFSTIIALNSALTKQLDAAWAVGNNQGGLDTGAETATAFYYLWAIHRPDTGVSDVLFSLSATAPTMPTNYTKKRRLGAVMNLGSSIKLFTQRGDFFTFFSPVLDVSSVSVTNTSSLHTLSVPRMDHIVARYRATMNGGGGVRELIFTSPSETDSDPDPLVGGLESMRVNANFTANAGEFATQVNGSGQIRARASAATDVCIATYGWIDDRRI